MEIDKTKELVANLVLVNDKVHFKGIVGTNEPISIDYMPPLGDNLGYTSLELLLISVSSCMGTAVVTFLRKMKKTVTCIEINSRGIKHQEHPTGFKTIYLDIVLISPDATNEDVANVIKLGEEKYCPVFAMVKGNVEIIINHKILNP